MNCNEHCTDRPLPGRLPFFPEPYPGESFYSILCRYHVRSGNINDRHTICQLFGYNSSMASTLLTPFHLEMASRWVPESPNIRPETMLRDNTAFPIYALSAYPCDIVRMREVITSQSATRSFPSYMQCRLASHTGKLRYCPACAAEQKKIYGEPYWQVLFQLDEVEYCPIHKIRVRNTSVSYKDICHHFYPASLILNSRVFTSCEPQTVWDDLFSTESDFFIRLSKNIAWILQNGIKFSGYDKLCASYERAIGKKMIYNTISVDMGKIKNSIGTFSRNVALYKYVVAKSYLLFYYGALFADWMKIYSHVLLMTILCGHPKVFYGET